MGILIVSAVDNNYFSGRILSVAIVIDAGRRFELVAT
jgi:hypothetical protein